MADWVGSKASRDNPVSDSEPTILIIGAGTFGTSTAFHLSRSYQDASKITIVDRAPSPPKPAASIDISRIIRTDYPNHLYSNLAYEAWHAWFWSLELQRYFHMTGWVAMDQEGSKLGERVRKVLSERSYDHTEDVLVDRIGQRWEALKGLESKGFKDAYFNSEAGWCQADAATANFMDAAVNNGINRVTAQVDEIVYENGRVSGVRTLDGQHLTADKILLAAGAWTSQLLSPIEETLNLPTNDRIERQVTTVGQVSAYYAVSDADAQKLADCKARTPVLIYGDQGEMVPPSEGNRTITITNYRNFTNTVTTASGHDISAPPGRDGEQATIPEVLKRETVELAARMMPEFVQGKEPSGWRICWDAYTPTQDWLACRHPHEGLRNLYIATGGSFHGYKYISPHLYASYWSSCADGVVLDSYPTAASTCSMCSLIGAMARRRTGRGGGRRTVKRSGRVCIRRGRRRGSWGRLRRRERGRGCDEQVIIVARLSAGHLRAARTHAS